MSIYCHFCHKQWRLKTEYHKHLTCCEYFYQLRRNPEMTDDFGGKIPSQRELFRLVQEFVNKCNYLEKEVSRLKKVIHTRNTKSIVECLNHPAQFPPYPFTEWWKEIPVTQTHLEMVFQGDLTDGMKRAIEEYLPTEPRRLPLRAFIQKPNMFYLYVGSSSSPWKVMQNADWEAMLLHLSQLLLKEFLKWQKENAHSCDEKSFERELNYMMKINGTKTSSEKRIGEMKKWLFPKLQENILDSTVEYV